MSHELSQLETHDSASGPVIVCPHCEGIQPPDAWDALSSDTLHVMHCNVCSKAFRFEFRDCPSCTTETVAAWPGDPPDEVATTPISCTHCGTAVRRTGDISDLLDGDVDGLY